MSQRFIRCAHCGTPHDAKQLLCPSTGLAVRGEKGPERASRSEPPPLAGTPAVHAALQPYAPATPVRPKARRDLVGQTLGGKYLVRGVLGEGGMGTVFEAQHLPSGTLVAVKVLHPNQARKADAVRRFHQEARSASTIGHPSICDVYELGTLDDGRPYLAMERLVGGTLASRIASQKGLPYVDVVDTIDQVLAALVAAHEKGIVHRDIKPENVFLTAGAPGSAPLVKLLDFGVSKMISPPMPSDAAELDITRAGMVMGTPHYLSPEQARGDRDLDGRVDVYACGVILYEALTGRRPFSAPNYETLLLQIVTSKPRPPSELRPGLPVALEAVVEKAMSRDRADRYQTAAELKRALLEVRDRIAVKEGPSGVLAPGPSSADAPCTEPVPSSIDIPISFSSDTLGSGETVSVDAGAVTLVGATLPELDDGPTELMLRPPTEDPFSLKSET
jgi:serine/threonine protein kinase